MPSLRQPSVQVTNCKPWYKQRRIQPHGIPWQPEHNLIAAMLEQALYDRQRTANRNWDGSWHHARRWINAMSEEPFGFAWCCRQVDQDPAHVRAAIEKQWAEISTQNQPISCHSNLEGDAAGTPPPSL